MTTQNPIAGSIAALATPFSENGVDEAVFARSIERQIREDSDGLLVGGIAGEGPTLSPVEKRRLVRIAVDIAEGRVPVLAVTGSNDTRATIEATRAAESAGAAAAVIVTPWYNKPTQDGFLRHVEAVARTSGIPLIVHTSPARTGIDIAPATIERLAALPTVCGMLDGSGDIRRVDMLRRLAPHWSLLAGEETNAVAFLLAGGIGAVWSVANLVPALCAETVQYARSGDLRRLRGVEGRLQPLIAALSIEGEPAPLKHALARLVPEFDARLRLPLVPASTAAAAAVDAALDAALGRVPAEA